MVSIPIKSPTLSKKLYPLSVAHCPYNPFTQRPKDFRVCKLPGLFRLLYSHCSWSMIRIGIRLGSNRFLHGIRGTFRRCEHDIDHSVETRVLPS